MEGIIIQTVICYIGYTVRAYNESGMSDYNSSNITESIFVSKPTTKLSNSAKGINVNWAKSKNAPGTIFIVKIRNQMVGRK